MVRSTLKVCLFAVAAAATFAATEARAALVLQAEFPSYTVATDGTTHTAVKLYLAQTGATTTLTDQGGINQFQINISPAAPSALPPTLALLTVNPEFTGNKIEMTSTGDLGGAFLDFTSGVAPQDGRVFLGTAEFTGVAGTTATTYAITAPAAEGYNFTATGTDLAGSIGAGQFVVAVPEPASLGLALLALPLLARRRR